MATESSGSLSSPLQPTPESGAAEAGAFYLKLRFILFGNKGTSDLLSLKGGLYCRQAGKDVRDLQGKDFLLFEIDRIPDPMEK